MGPKKEIKKPLEVVLPSIDSPVNTDEWRCAVVMAVEKSYSDNFVLKEFEEEASSKCRRDVTLISYDHLVLKILQDFINGELPFKYSYLLHFSSIFQEAAEYIKSKSEIPVQLLVKVVKVLLYFYREESLKIIASNQLGPKDPVTIMMERPYVSGAVSKDAKSNINKKEQRKGKNQLNEQNAGIKLRPPSFAKEGTKLLRREEIAKETVFKCIDDAPYDGYFNLYVLLTGFYNPEFPMELIKAQVPLHQVLCIDTDFSGVKYTESANFKKTNKKSMQNKPYEIQLFWDDFLKILWSPKKKIFFKDVIFQKYIPIKLGCEYKQRREFIYREISYLMYDLSEYKKQHLNYLKNMKLWDVSEESDDDEMKKRLGSISYELPNECITIPVVLQNILNILSHTSEMNDSDNSSENSVDSRTDTINLVFPESDMFELPYSAVMPLWSQIIKDSGNINNLKVYSKLKELDLKYYICENTLKKKSVQKQNVRERSRCEWSHQKISKNLAQAFDCNGTFASYWTKYKKSGSLRSSSFSAVLDYSLYVFLASKLICPFEESKLKSSPNTTLSEIILLKKNSSFELIKNLDKEFRKPHFTVTDCSRNVVKCIPWNLKNTDRDFFCPQKYKIVTPEKVKTSSAPEIRLPVCFINEASFISDFYVSEEAKKNIKWTAYTDMTNFCKKNNFLNANGFNFVEELNKTKLLKKKQKYWNEFNCIDHSYSVLTDSIFMRAHNKKNPNNFFSETFNQCLKSSIGLRDFFEYTLEDESNWISHQEILSEKKNPTVVQNTLFKSSFDAYSDTDFWLENSIKYQEYVKLTGNVLKIKKDDYLRKKSVGNKEIVKLKSSEKFSDAHGSIIAQENSNEKNENEYCFEGYNVDEVAVQFSGIKTEYFVQDCSITVDLLERLYGKQHLGVHVRHGGNTLHLYSYVCPEPHIVLPYTFHLTYKNGIILSFGQRLLKETIDTQEVEQLSTDFDSPKSNETLNNCKIREDERFSYDLKLSIPNGLMVEVVPNIVEPCYIKQYFLNDSSINDVKNENCRIFLPNGNVISIKKDNTFIILKGNTSIVSGSLNNITNETMDDEKLKLKKYNLITPMSYNKTIENGIVKSSKKIQISEHIDIESKQTFYRRMDGTNYVIKNDGSISVQFKDNTKISRCPFFGGESFKNDAKESIGESFTDSEETDFTVIYEEIIIEHPSYSTVIYNSRYREWKIILPDESKITVKKNGYYSVIIDNRTEMKINKDLIHMNRYSTDLNLICGVTVNPNVFSVDNVEKIYCKMVNETLGETFIVESNSNTYILANEKQNGKINASQKMNSQTPPENVTETKGNKLSLENKYFILRKDFSGIQILHVDDVRKTLLELEKGTLVYVQEFDELKKLRCFVIITPVSEDYFQEVYNEKMEWKTKSIIPNPVCNSKNSETLISSTYGIPPSWMHPFPKKRKKFVVPDNLTCNVFIETGKTDLQPGNGSIDHFFCEHVDSDDYDILWKTKCGDDNNKKEDFIRRLSDDDQILLKKMYSRVASKLINEKKKLRPFNKELLDRYLKMSKYYNELRDYHKNSIRYHTIPNYFQHPAGMSWLLIDSWINELKLTESKTKLPETGPETVSIDSIKSHSTFSNEEIEYNLSLSSIKSFSDLNYYSDLSAKSGPPNIHEKNVCTCKVKPVMRNALSAPLYLFKDKTDEPVDNFEKSQNILQMLNEFNQNDGFKNIHADKKLLPSKPKIQTTTTLSPSSTLSYTPPSLPSPSFPFLSPSSSS